MDALSPYGIRHLDMPLTAEKICTAPSSRALSAPPFLGLTPPAGMKRDRQEYPDAPNDPSLLTDQRPIGIADSPNPSTHCLSARPRVRHWSPPPDLSPDRRYVPWLLKVGEPRAIGGCASAVALAAPDAHPRQGRTGRRGREHPHSPQSLACGRQRAAGISPFLKQYVRSLTPDGADAPPVQPDADSQARRTSTRQPTRPRSLPPMSLKIRKPRKPSSTLPPASWTKCRPSEPIRVRPAGTNLESGRAVVAVQFVGVDPAELGSVAGDPVHEAALAG